MLFHTWHFLIFFGVVYGVYRWLRRTRFSLYWLLAASYFFYGWWNPAFLLLILYATAVNFFAVVLMERSRRKKLWLAVGLGGALAPLVYFKYANFILTSLNALLARWGLPAHLPAPAAFLPVGISFFTFQAMSYTIDVYRGHLPREPSFLRFATFVALFPQLVAGPIERAANLLPQLTGEPKAASRADIAEGLSLFLVGLFKKVALADYLALYVDPIYADPGRCDGLTLALATFAFSWQIYFDFSGYTDMARGVGKILGFEFRLNFNNPYCATSLRDFWNRWHISLSTWFKDYVYIPLGGNRRGPFNTYKNMFLTMLISGLWHGAAWTFVLWGFLHAVGRCLTREWESTAFYREKVPRLVKQLAVFSFVTFGWIFFRAHSLADAWLIVQKIFQGSLADPRFPVAMLALCLSVWLYQFLFESPARGLLARAPLRVGVAFYMVCHLLLFTGASNQPFVYFQF